MVSHIGTYIIIHQSIFKSAIGELSCLVSSGVRAGCFEWLNHEPRVIRTPLHNYGSVQKFIIESHDIPWLYGLEFHPFRLMVSSHGIPSYHPSAGLPPLLCRRCCWRQPQQRGKHCPSRQRRGVPVVFVMILQEV